MKYSNLMEPSEILRYMEKVNGYNETSSPRSPKTKIDSLSRIYD
jgi:hypothetical protein